MSVTCTVCKETKAETEFRAEPRKKNGLRSNCRVCERALARQWQRVSGQNKRWREQNREAWVQISRRSNYMRRYGITVEQYEELFDAQEGCCAICGSADPRMRKGARQLFCVDHDHKTGQVRGLLCMPCNTALGNFGDDLDRVEKAARYLQGARAERDQDGS